MPERDMRTEHRPRRLVMSAALL
ncbi:hypothetical protein XAB3213_1610008 [Xanthomonas citri pv. bilvae]|nr:hypothetical protein XAB3213_1610008 [Xanthomonas citri pv. bilvae]